MPYYYYSERLRLFPSCLQVVTVALLAVSCLISCSGADASLSSSMSGGGDFSGLPPTIFAPGGRLHSVERTLQAVNRDDPMNNLVIAIKCQEGIVVVTSEVVSPYLLTTNMTEASTTEGTTTATTEDDENDKNETKETTTTASTKVIDSSSSFPSLVLPDTGVARPPFCRLTTNLWGITAGNAADAQILRIQMHGVAETILHGNDDDEKGSNGDGLRGRIVARSLADRRQYATQQADEDGLLNATALIVDQFEENAGLWRVDPTGQFFSCQAAVVGRKAHLAEADLVARLSAIINPPKETKDETLQSQGSEGSQVEIVKDAHALQECLASLSRRDALEMAVECIRTTLAPKATSSSGTTAASLPVSLKALMLHHDNVEWISDREL